ncbi:MAG: DUF1189 domain-containing protein [Nitrospirae bacterium]|nr:DUF1189 domain-containing protein [Nitrospirota bacterium]
MPNREMEMPKISFWENLTISFQPSAYRKIVSQPLGRSFRYLVVFLLLFSALLSIKYTFVLRQELEKAREWINANGAATVAAMLPEEIKIENGQVSTSAKEPFVRKWDLGEGNGKEEVTFIIDTTGQIPNLDKYQDGLLLTKDKLIFKNTKPGGAAETREEDLSKVKFFALRRGDAERGELVLLTFDKKAVPVTYESIKKWQGTISRLLPLLIIPLFLYYLIAKTVHLFFFSLSSLIIRDLTRSGLEYKDLLNIGIFALIPPTTLVLLVQLAGAAIPYLAPLYILIYLLFLFKGIKGSRIEVEEETRL